MGSKSIYYDNIIAQIFFFFDSCLKFLKEKNLGDSLLIFLILWDT